VGAGGAAPGSDAREAESAGAAGVRGRTRSAQRGRSGEASAWVRRAETVGAASQEQGRRRVGLAGCIGSIPTVSVQASVVAGMLPVPAGLGRFGARSAALTSPAPSHDARCPPLAQIETRQNETRQRETK
jgi:hypothetical protein